MTKILGWTTSCASFWRRMPPPFKACGFAHEDACTRRLDLVATMHTITALECVCKAWPGIMEPFWLELHKRITGLAPMSTGKKDLHGCAASRPRSRARTPRASLTSACSACPTLTQATTSTITGTTVMAIVPPKQRQENDGGGMKPILAWSMRGARTTRQTSMRVCILDFLENAQRHSRSNGNTSASQAHF